MVTPSQTIYIGTHIHTLQGQPLLQTLHFVPHAQSPQGDPHSRNCTCTVGPVYTVSRETPPHRPCIWGFTAKVSRVNPPCGPCTWVTVSRVSPSRPWTWGHISTVSWVTPLCRHYTWGHISTVSRVIRSPQTEQLGSHVHNLG